VATVTRPPSRVLSAFGLLGKPVRLVGGQGTSWRVGDVVLKPRVDPVFQEWLGTEVAGIPQRGFRLPAVRQAVDGAWTVEGWGGLSAVDGFPGAGARAEWPTIINAARALHDATAALTRPAFLDLRSDPWAEADRDAWGEIPRQVLPELRGLVEKLQPALSPPGPAQLVHGDLTNNVLLAVGQSPGIIDISPYWRPRDYAEGIVLADALSWHRAPAKLLEEVDVPPAAVARGLLFRILAASRIHRERSPGLVDEAHRYGVALDALRQ
jgi:uncharacterized protein (TIGR02569 family)